MNLHALDVPESTREIADWLEGHLVGLHLGALAAELLTIHGDAPHKPLEAILGDDLDRVLQGGLAGVSRDKLTDLLRHPTALLELQERIVLEGDQYWQKRAQANGELQSEISRGWDRLQAAISSARVPPQPPPPSKGTVNLARRIIVLALTAALIVIGVTAFWQTQAPPPQVASWGWDRPGALPDRGTPAEYFNALADGAQQWFAKRPGQPEGLEKRLTEFRHGCETLIAADHKPLSPEDRAWLVERCRKWKAKIETHLADLKATGNAAKVRDAADETVNTLIRALRGRKPMSA